MLFLAANETRENYFLFFTRLGILNEKSLKLKGVRAVVLWISLLIYIIIVMFNVICHRAEILVFLVFCCDSRYQPDVKVLTTISFSGYLTG